MKIKLLYPIPLELKNNFISLLDDVFDNEIAPDIFLFDKNLENCQLTMILEPSEKDDLLSRLEFWVYRQQNFSKSVELKQLNNDEWQIKFSSILEISIQFISQQSQLEQVANSQ